MPSRRRKAREAAMKALYQNDLVGHDLLESLDQVVAEDHLQLALEAFAREFVSGTPAVQANVSGIERFITDFAGISLAMARDPLQLRGALLGLIDESFPKDRRAAIAGDRNGIDTLVEKASSKAKNVSQLLTFARELVVATQDHQKEIDEVLSRFADHWSIERMASLDRSILRFATCELLFFSEIPVNVTINEAIEIAKKFSTERSCEFVNGILDKIQRELKPGKNDPRKKSPVEAPENTTPPGATKE